MTDLLELPVPRPADVIHPLRARLRRSRRAVIRRMILLGLPMVGMCAVFLAWPQLLATRAGGVAEGRLIAIASAAISIGSYALAIIFGSRRIFRQYDAFLRDAPAYRATITQRMPARGGRERIAVRWETPQYACSARFTLASDAGIEVIVLAPPAHRTVIAIAGDEVSVGVRNA